MTLTDQALTTGWTVEAATAHDYPLIADFLATTPGLRGRKFAADSRDVAEQLAGVYPGSAVVLRSESADVLGYAALYQPDGAEPEVLADFVFSPEVGEVPVAGVVDDTVDRFHRQATPAPICGCTSGPISRRRSRRSCDAARVGSASSSRPVSRCSVKTPPRWRLLTSTD